MNTKLALLSAALLAISPMAIAQDTGNTEADVGDTSPADTTISGSGEAAQEDRHGDPLVGDAMEPDLEEISPAAGTDYFEEWDADDDTSLTMDEFNQGVDEMGTYDAWDTDGDGVLSRDEYNVGMYESFDSNDDDVIDEEEFSAYSQDSDLPY